jgi:hypothetical protein
MRDASIPDYWLKQPNFEVSQQLKDKLESLWQNILLNPEPFDEQLQKKTIPWIENLPVPKWVFLRWLTEEKNLLVHGSSQANIDVFEPRPPNAKDDDEFSQQTAVFAASDGIWPMFYAIIDREHFRPRLLNGGLRFELSSGPSDIRYFFSVTQAILEQYPWRSGVMYLLPKDGFTLQPPHPLGNFIIHEVQWANLNAVRPLAKLKIIPEDFPFLQQVKGHDNKVVQARAEANPTGFPWL